MIMLFWSFIQIFLFCEFGERLTRQFININKELAECDWYKFPLNIRKLLPMVLNGTQNPLVLTGIGQLKCTRETFKAVSGLFFNDRLYFFWGTAFNDKTMIVPFNFR